LDGAGPLFGGPEAVRQLCRTLLGLAGATVRLLATLLQLAEVLCGLTELLHGLGERRLRLLRALLRGSRALLRLLAASLGLADPILGLGELLLARALCCGELLDPLLSLAAPVLQLGDDLRCLPELLLGPAEAILRALAAVLEPALAIHLRERAARLEEALLGLSEARGRVVRPIEGVAEEALGVLQQIFRRIFALVDLRHFALPHLGRRVHPTQ